MKVIIDIPEDFYKGIMFLKKKTQISHNSTVQIPLEILANAVSVDDIKAEIEKLPTYDRVYSYGMVEAVVSKYDVSRIIDKNTSGKESE